MAAGLALVAGLAATVSVTTCLVPGPHGATRAQPLDWLSMLPLVWWVNGLVRFEPRAVRRWRSALALACLGAGAGLTAAMWRAEDWTLPALGCAVTLASAGASLAVHCDSLVAREGPAR
ncbi:hypothetical protein [Methylobacterium sp. J-090]|uniref:hypothetical protein n=1 Tax=Methylobacterium sp. J-090 TaxID=2836666 RepID=UPI001FB917DE|nr:hypothetical protein [Methylobacterium sp. J-090]MCJ2081820.1 hypothetical protein [Methylobacterium sp. J-090]